MLRYETETRGMGFSRIAGVDEAGRGPLAGPVVAAAVVLPAGISIEGLTDSKKLSPAAREKYYSIIQIVAEAVGVGIVREDAIDEINILQASLLAMKQAVAKLPVPADYLLIDGNRTIESPLPQKAIVKGDSLSLSIAAASVIAKVTRDRMMDVYHEKFPTYGFDKHRGYGTQLHLDRIKQFGPCPIHRKTFKGVREYAGTVPSDAGAPRDVSPDRA